MKTSFIDFQNVNISDSFWQDRQTLNATVTIRSIYEKFKETGRFESAKLSWRQGEPNEPHIFWDSDIAKWIEAAAYIVQKHYDPELVAICDETIDIIAAKQEDSGYYNIHFQTCEPHARFTRRTEHELYCAGHLIEAAVAYYEATKKDKLLKVVCKYADYIEKVFVKDKTSKFITPGHEEIELALVKLYHCTGEKRYLALSKFFIDQRGKHDTDFYDFANACYAQDHLPVREQTTAEGHSVRACYLYTAMADLALEYGDKELEKACQTIFDNIIQKRMYITGGIGSTYFGESFSIDYDLPNDIAYSESCAAIALVFFAKRMLDLEVNSKYSDTIERVFYNGFLSSISLNGKAFFYKNPLEIIPEFENRFPATKDTGNFPEMERLEVFECSCCPPNISRLLATIGGYIYSTEDQTQTLLVHQYISSQTDGVEMKSGFPNDGTVTLTVDGYQTIAVRIPGWCTEYTILKNGQKAEGTLKNGYLYLPCDGKTKLDIRFSMPIVFMESNSNVTQNAGKICCMRGPLVYCAEKSYNQYDIHKTYFAEDAAANAEISYDPTFHANTITMDAFVKTPRQELYYPASKIYEKTKVKLIPYYGFANKGASEMMVWLNKK